MTLHMQPETSHLFHLAMTVISFGAWSVIWLLLALVHKTRTQCGVCGRRSAF